MHYKDGTEVKRGDIFKHTSPHAPEHTVIGVAAKLNPGTDTCNILGTVVLSIQDLPESRLVLPGSGSQYLNSFECELVHR